MYSIQTMSSDFDCSICISVFIVMIIYTIYLQKTLKRLIMVADMNLVKIFFNVIPLLYHIHNKYPFYVIIARINMNDLHLSLKWFEFDFCLPKFGNISSLKDMIRLKIYKNINILSLKLQEGI